MENIVLVTGVNSGLGRAFAVALLDAGWTVVGTVRKQEAVEEFERLRLGMAFARVLDVTDVPEQLAALVAEVEQSVGPGAYTHQQCRLWTRRHVERKLDAGASRPI